MTLTEFLLARIAEDDGAARAAGESSWHVECFGGGDWLDDDERREHFAGPSHEDECGIDGPDIHIYDEGGHSPAQARHIARFDPARVLAECEAKRRIVGEHPSYGGHHEHCATCYGDDELAGNDWPCATLRALGQPYADHPDFRDEWRGA